MRNRHVWTVLFAATSLVGCAVEEVQQGEGPRSQLEQQIGAKPVPVEQVPVEVYRRVAQHLEDVRGTQSAPGWETATLSTQVQVLYRPDVSGPAYYEFRVLVGQESRGYIIASAGSHDFPIAHWNYQDLPPTELLARRAGTTVGAFYKLDSLSYAAEDVNGRLVADLGRLPPRIDGQDPSWVDEPIEPTTATWVPSLVTKDDSQAKDVQGRLVIEGPSVPREIRLGAWRSWDELKSGYAFSYATLAEAQRRQADQDWQVNALVKEYGEGLAQGERYDIALLYTKPSIKLVGEGAQYVRASLLDTAPGRQVLSVTAVGSVAGRELPLRVELLYPNGTFEAVNIVVLSPKDVGRADSAGTKSAMGRSGEVHIAWGPWNEFWAGTHGHQRLYDQMAAGSSPNTSSCWSGCGGTAWAMLFGWGDNQAALGNPAWAHRTGLYRVNGGYGSNAVAPVSMDTGVRNMTWEIRNRIGTFCITGSGATFPWDMGQASGYLAGRTGASLSTHYNVFGIHEDRLRDRARDSIVNRKVPAIIGTGWLQHYPLAYGYRWRSRTVRRCFILCWNETQYQREFYVNQGWGGSGNSWVGAGTWFAGQLYAN